MTWHLADHTADVAIECEGPTRESVLADAATALSAVVTGSDDPRWFVADREMEVQVEAPDPDALVVAWLSELLWMLESKGDLWITGGTQVQASNDGGLSLQALGNGVRYDAARHGQGTEVKAVTYHDLHLGRHRDGAWRLRVLLDI